MGILTKFFDLLVGGLISKWKARKALAQTFGVIKRRILHIRIVIDYPTELKKLRDFLIETGLNEKAGFKEFYEPWLSNPLIQIGLPIVNPLSSEDIAHLKKDLSTLKLEDDPEESQMKPFTTAAIVVFELVCLAHILRLSFGCEVLINGWPVPIWVSAMGAIATGTLAVMLWRESR